MRNPNPHRYFELIAAFDALGRLLFPDEWDETEKSARDLPPPDDAVLQLLEEIRHAQFLHWRTLLKHASDPNRLEFLAEHTPKPNLRTMSNKLPRNPGLSDIGGSLNELFEYDRIPGPEWSRWPNWGSAEYKKEFEAHRRREDVESVLRRRMASGKVKAVLHDSRSGESLSINPSNWLGTDLELNFSGYAAGRSMLEGFEGWVLIDRPQFDALLANRDGVRRVGRPLAPRKTIRLAYEELKRDGRIDFGGPRNQTYEPIRKILRRVLGEETTVSNETLRTTTKPWFEQDETEAQKL